VASGQGCGCRKCARQGRHRAWREWKHHPEAEGGSLVSLFRTYAVPHGKKYPGTALVHALMIIEIGKFQLGHGAGSSAVTMTMDALLDCSVESDVRGTAR
jgi:hypothetical protein